MLEVLCGVVIRVFTWSTEVETLNSRLGLRTAVWIPTKVRDRGLGLRPKLYAGPVCDNSAADAAYTAIVALCM